MWPTVRRCSLVLAALVTGALGCRSERASGRDAGRDVVPPPVIDAVTPSKVARDGGEQDGDAAVVGGGDAGDAGDGGAPAGEASTARVVHLTRIGDHGAALAVLEALPRRERERPALRYLRGRLLERLERPAEVEEALDLPAGALPPRVEADARRRRLLALAATGRCDEARAIADQLGKGLGRRRPAARTAVAVCEHEAGRHERAVRELTALADAGGPGLDEWAVGTALAEALAATGRREEAAARLRSILLSHPEHAGADAAFARMKALGGAAELTATERLTRAKRLLARRRFARAVAELPPSSRPSRPGQLARWLHLRGMALYRMRTRYAEAAKVLAEAARFGGSDAIEDAFHSARALSRADLDDQAIKAYRRLVDAHPHHPRAVEAEYLAAWLELRHGRRRGAVNMQKFLSGPRGSKNARLEREATWHLAFRAFEQGQLPRAGQLFGRYARLGQDGLVRGRGLYWQARALEKMGRAKRAAAVYRAAIKVEPFHWYALLAKQRLDDLGEEAGPPILPAPPGRAPAPLPRVPLPPEVAFYSALGLDEDALEALRAREPEIRASLRGARELEALVEVYHRIGGYRRAFRLTRHERDHLRRAPGPRTRWLWDAAYPRPHRAAVRRWCDEYGVDPAHVYATMRQESGYSPRVVSHADAIGLLQMLPSTARRLSAKMGVTVTRQKLFDPAFNVRIGIFEISGLLKSFDGNVPLSIAAYNAGEKRVRRWLRETGPTDLDLFVERIPFDETRGYVRRVTTHLARYRYLEDPAHPWAVSLPRKVAPDPRAAPEVR